MTYTEWRDELKKNLLCVSDAERQRVLDYYAEAYADRREAGFSEREIINGFGAPYDAAQRILYEKADDGARSDQPKTQPPKVEQLKSEQTTRQFTPPPPPPVNAQPAAGVAVAAHDNTWIFVLLCIIFCMPIFGIIMGMVGITIGFCVAPVAVIAAGATVAGASIGAIVGGSVAYGFSALGIGIIILGVGVTLCPLFFKLVSLMWNLFGKLFKELKSLFQRKGE